VKEAMATLRGEGPSDFTALVETVAAEMLRLGGKATTPEEARALVAEVIASGAAWQKFREFVVAQGGDPAQVDHPELLPEARWQVSVSSYRSGYVAAIDAYEVGLVTMHLGGGRAKKGDPIDHAVGVVLHKKVGDWVEAGEPLCEIHANDPDRLKEAEERLLAAYQLSDTAITPPPLIHKIITASPQRAG